MKKRAIIPLLCIILVLLAGCANDSDVQFAGQEIIDSEVRNEIVSSGFEPDVSIGLTASKKIEKNTYEISGHYSGELDDGTTGTGDFSFTVSYDSKTKTASKISDTVYTGAMMELREKAIYTDEYEKIVDLAVASETVCGVVYDIWNIVGVEDAASCLHYMLNIPEDFDTFWNAEETISEKRWQCKIGDEYGWLNNDSFGISFETDAKEFHQMCMEFQENYAKVETLNSEVAADIKDMRDTYAVEHEEEFELLNELYLEVSVFADFSLNPSGSLISYVTTYNEYETSIQKLMKAADIY